MTFHSQSGFSLVEVVVTMSVVGILLVLGGEVYSAGSQIGKSTLRSDVTSVKAFFRLASQRSYVSGTCSVVTKVDDKNLTLVSYKLSDPGCTGNFAQPDGDMMTLTLASAQSTINDFSNRSGGIARTVLVYNKEGGTVVPNHDIVDIRISDGVEYFEISVLSAIGQVVDHLQGTTGG